MTQYSSAAPPATAKKSVLRDYLESIAFAIVIALVLRTFVVQAFKIPSGSMENTLAVGDYILVNKFIYGIELPFTDRHLFPLRSPKRGDIAVFEYPEDPSRDFVKRVIGVPGDRIQIVDKKVFINGTRYVNPHEIHKDSAVIAAGVNQRDNTGVITVPPASYFMMGDNRDQSYDSRFWGFVRIGRIKGLAFVKYWSWDTEGSRVRWDYIGRLLE
ncbi:MAG: signal peptidase I [Nitrospiraceae bacterium]|nr:signal peptidase I [Nitrospiraceae bacterium]